MGCGGSDEFGQNTFALNVNHDLLHIDSSWMVSKTKTYVCQGDCSGLRLVDLEGGLPQNTFARNAKTCLDLWGDFLRSVPFVTV